MCQYNQNILIFFKYFGHSSIVISTLSSQRNAHFENVLLYVDHVNLTVFLHTKPFPSNWLQT